ncbi:hypothetical protein QE363_000770 [Sphingomonas sp. SORGH_AS870]|uniref:hypothetical protein n=1 Tax=Sphingomonas sp. SORGH_AS_0870 TaxID=3041801 RepID=UPI002865F00E|nr:hypothetical protein [Sphingomonas sp. SORGH_AS_0870]MDR6144977.1 hypothetical protein [Sphingomonas sp. SORGH_AS_0870]
MNTQTPVQAKCAASPDHDDILETLENAADDWRTKGYASALSEVRDMANIGRALMTAIADNAGCPPLIGWHPADCPSEIVVDLLNMMESNRFTKLVDRIANWSDDELKFVSPRQVRHIAQVVIAGADPEYPPFELEGRARIEAIESAIRIGIFNTCVQRGMSQDAAIAIVRGTMEQLCVASALSKAKDDRA